ncbi:MAG: aminotransferase class I/II-fold pyridoxal phosphate-dependent enzyme [Bilophila wadsworthia]
MPIRFETLAVHGGQHPDPTTLSRGVPVYQTSSYLFKSAEHAAKLFGLAEQGNVYGRLGNPTQAMLEERMSLLEGGVGALASASGTSAIFSTIVNLAKQGDEIVSANNLYGGTFTLFNDILPQFGITTRFVKPQDFDKMEAAVNGRTRALYVEAIGNPALDVADLDAVSAIAKRHGLPLVVDATFATPYLLRPFEHGADIVVHSLTKWLGGTAQLSAASSMAYI